MKALLNAGDYSKQSVKGKRVELKILKGMSEQSYSRDFCLTKCHLKVSIHFSDDLK